MKPRLLVTAATLPRFAGDPEPRFELDLARALTARFEVTVLAPADPAAALEDMVEDVRILRYRYAPARNLDRLAYPGAIVPRLKRQPLYLALVPFLIAGLRRAVS
ncbi:MAG: hypothetical protein FJX56_03920 [Alphaproteobacteria bacterium]|nr:hypothetical protein [Alphaproteobacteria bacterium]